MLPLQYFFYYLNFFSPLHLSYIIVVCVLSLPSLGCPPNKYQFGYLPSNRGSRKLNTILPVKSDKNRVEEA